MRSYVVQCEKQMRNKPLSQSQLKLTLDCHPRPLCFAPEQNGETGGSNYRKWGPPGN